MIIETEYKTELHTTHTHHSISIVLVWARLGESSCMHATWIYVLNLFYEDTHFYAHQFIYMRKKSQSFYFRLRNLKPWVYLFIYKLCTAWYHFFSILFIRYSSFLPPDSLAFCESFVFCTMHPLPQFFFMKWVFSHRFCCSKQPTNKMNSFKLDVGANRLERAILVRNPIKVTWMD